MKKIQARFKFLSYALFVIVALIFVLRFLTYPLMTFALKQYFNTDLSFSGFYVSGFNSFKIKDIRVEKPKFFYFYAEELEFSPGRKYSGIFTAKWILEKLSVKQGLIILEDSLFEESEEAEDSFFELPFFPLEKISLDSLDVRISVNDLDLEILDISLKGSNDYQLSAFLMVGHSSLNTPFHADMSAEFSAEEYSYALKKLSFLSDGIAVNIFETEDFENTDIAGHIEADLQMLSPYIGEELKGFVEAVIIPPSSENKSFGIRFQGENIEYPAHKISMFDVFGDMSIYPDEMVLNQLVAADENRIILSADGKKSFDDSLVSGNISLYKADFKNIMKKVSVDNIVDMKVSGEIDYSFDTADMTGNAFCSLKAHYLSVDSGKTIKIDDYHDVTADMNFNKERISIEKAEIVSGDKINRIFLENAWFDFDGDGSLRIPVKEGSMVEVKKAGLLDEMSFSAYGAVTGIIEGPYSSPVISGRFDGSSCFVEGFSFDRCGMDVVYDDSVLSFSIDNLKTKSVNIEKADLAVNIAKDVSVDFSVSGLKGDVGDLKYITGENIPISGDFRLSAEGRYGNYLEKLKASLVMDGFSIEEVPVADKIKLFLSDEPEKVRVYNSSASYGGNELTVEGVVDKRTFEMNLSAGLESFSKKDFSGLESLKAKTNELSAKITGTVYEPAVDVDISFDDIIYEDIKMGDLSLLLFYRGQTGIFSFSGDLGDSIELNGEMKDFSLPSLRADMKVKNFLHKVSDYFVKTSFTGKIEKEEVAVDFTKLFVEYKDIFIQNNRPFTISGTPEHMVLPKTFFGGELSNFSVEGELKNGIPKLKLSGNVYPRILSAFYVSQIQNVSGNLYFDILLEDRDLEGEVKLRDVSFMPRDIKFPVKELEGAFYFEGDSWHIDEIRGEAGGGRTLISGSGSLSVEDPVVNLSVVLENATTKWEPVGDFSFSSDIKVSYDHHETVMVNGNVMLKNLVYRNDIDLENELVSMLIAEGKRRYTGGAVSGADSGLFLDLSIKGQHNIKVDSNLLKTGLTFDLSVRGKPENPVIGGTVNLKDGLLFFRKNTFEIKRGIITKQRGEDSKPYIDVEASTTIDVEEKDHKTEYNITLLAEGYYDRMQITLLSSPDLEQEKIYSLLLWGSPGGGEDTGNVAITAVVTNILGITGEVKKNLRLAQFDLVPKYSEFDDKTVLKLIAVKEIYPSFFITLESNTYDASDQYLELRYKREDAEFSLEWKSRDKLESDFGGIGFDVELDYIFK